MSTGNSTDKIVSICTDSSGNIYALGNSQLNTITFDTHTFSSKNINDIIFVVKIDSLGNATWLKGLNSTGSVSGSSISIDHKGALYVVGNYDGNTSFDLITLNRNTEEDSELFIARISNKSFYEISSPFCSNDLSIVLSAMDNYNSYTWTDSNDKVIGNSLTVTINNPVDSAVYSCKFKDSQDSTFIVRYTLLKTIQKADFTSSLSDCKTNTVQFTNQSTSNQGNLTYLWDFGDGNTSTELSPLHNYTSDGNHQVGLLIQNSLSGCMDSIHKTITFYPKPTIKITGDSILCHGVPVILKAQGAATYKWSNGSTADSVQTTNPQKVWAVGYSTSGCVSDTVFVKITDSTPLVTITGYTTYCSGYPTSLKAHGASNYEWSDGSNADSIVVNTDTTVWVLGYTADCISDTLKYKVSEEPDFNMQIDGNMYFCTGSSTILKVSGADSYLWNTGEQTNTVTFNQAGDYFVTGFNNRGCEKTIPVKIVENDLPVVDFSVTPTTVDTRHNTVKCSIADQSGVDYTWDMGDGNTESGAEIQHSYSVSNSMINYKISLTATNLQGCTNTASKNVDILLFIPNIFSPNGDGVNDLFMPGIDTEIIDRNGLSLYRGTGGWDGDYHNSKMPDDTYYYVVTYKDNTGKTQTQKGYLILKR